MNGSARERNQVDGLSEFKGVHMDGQPRRDKVGGSAQERERANGWVNSREKSQHMGGVLLEVVQVDSLDRREIK